jgi:Arc/MetJ family transcription regulator
VATSFLFALSHIPAYVIAGSGLVVLRWSGLLSVMLTSFFWGYGYHRTGVLGRGSSSTPPPTSWDSSYAQSMNELMCIHMCNTVCIRRWISVGRTNIVIDDSLMEKAMAVSGLTTKREVVEKALMEFVQHRTRKDLLQLEGKIRFREGYDHRALREGRNRDPR